MDGRDCEISVYRPVHQGQFKSTTGEQHQRYQALTRNCRNVDGRTDVSALVKSLDIPNPPRPLHRFCPPQLPQTSDGEDGPHTPQDLPQPTYHNEVVEDRLAEVCTRTRLESLSREAAELTRQIQQNQESQEGLVRAQQRSLDAGIHNKANEIQEDISLKRFDIRVAQLHLGAVKAQKELFSPRDGTGVEGRDRKMSSSSTGSMKSKWMKAFKSLKTPSSSSNPPKESADRRTGGRGGELSPPILENSHIFQEYTYKKISACDVCHQILKGHSRQGLKCKLCKVNVHPDCQAEAPRCQPKSRLLRRQRSTSELETKHIEVEEDDCGEPNLTFNSLIASQPGRRTLEPPSPTGLGPHDQAPSSPVHHRRLLSARAMRMSSVELPDDNEKSLSSASTSPCPSPVSKKPHRLLPTNLYVVLYNFTARQGDELDLRAGNKVTVTDTSDIDWWQGKCLGRLGYFPSKYVTRLNGGERPLQVTHNLQVTDGDTGLKLLRDQIVIQIGEEIDGMVMIRNGDHQQGVCPVKYLQEV